MIIETSSFRMDHNYVTIIRQQIIINSFQKNPMGSEIPMANSVKICANKDCGMQLQPGDQYCASCGTKVPEPHAFDRKYLVAIGIGFLIIGILAGAYASKNWYDNQDMDNASNRKLDNASIGQIKDEDILFLKGKNALDIKEKLYYYGEAVNKTGSRSDIWGALGDIEYFNMKNYSNALKYYRTASEINPNFREAVERAGDASFEIAFSSRDSGDLDNACKYYDKALQISTSALNKKSNILLNWTENIENSDSKRVELLNLALESSDLSIKIYKNDSDSWEIRKQLYMWLYTLTNDTTYRVQADECQEMKKHLLDARMNVSVDGHEKY